MLNQPICMCDECDKPIRPRPRVFGGIALVWVFGANLDGRDYCYHCWPLARLRAMHGFTDDDCARLDPDVRRTLSQIAAPGRGP